MQRHQCMRVGSQLNYLTMYPVLTDLFQVEQTPCVVSLISGFFNVHNSGKTSSAIRSFFLAMMCFPEAQKKAQEEIDRVIGSDRLPTIADRERLPYVRALCWEVLRWRPIAPLGQSETPRLSASLTILRRCPSSPDTR